MYNKSKMFFYILFYDYFITKSICMVLVLVKYNNPVRNQIKMYTFDYIFIKNDKKIYIFNNNCDLFCSHSSLQERIE